MRVLTQASGALLLVNAAHAIQTSAAPDLVCVDPRWPEIQLERRAAGLLNACIRAVGGEHTIIPVSGWRSREEQKAIWDDTLVKEGEVFTRQYVARPGCSEHQTGLAIDLGLASEEIDFIRPNFPYSGVCGSFRKLAADYGFILRYPAGKETVTGIAHEPWHFRYVGVPHARFMAEQGLVLEEYMEVQPAARSISGTVMSQCGMICSQNQEVTVRCRRTTAAVLWSPPGGEGPCLYENFLPTGPKGTEWWASGVFTVCAAGQSGR